MKTVSRLRRGMDALDVMVAVFNKGGEVAFINKKIEGVTGNKLKDLSRMGWFNRLFLPEGDEHFKNAFMDTAMKSKSTPFESTLVNRAGNTRLIDWSISTVEARKGKTYLVVTGKDITGQRATEETVRKNEVMYRKILESSAAAMVIVEGDGVISFANDATKKITGYPKKELRGKSATDLVSTQDKKVLNEAYRLAKIGRTPSHPFKAHLITREGKDRHILAKFKFIPGTEKCVCSFIDITERKKAENALKERIKELNCIYELSRYFEEKLKATIEQIYKKTVDLLKPAMQYPKHTHAKITQADGREFTTKGYKPKRVKGTLAATIRVDGKDAGTLQVVHTKKLEFLKEEQALLDALAERLGKIAQRKKAESELEETKKLLMEKTRKLSKSIPEVIMVIEELRRTVLKKRRKKTS